MKYNLFIISILLLISCSNKKQQRTIPIIDVTKNYPKKEIVLQDIADVEYIRLETKDDVLLSRSGKVIYSSKDLIIARNLQEGDVFVFNGKGKIISSFNHKGQGATEYIRLSKVMYNSTTNEIFVYTRDKPGYKIMVYNLQGQFQREVHIQTKISLERLHSFNKELIIAYETPNIADDENASIISMRKEAKVSNIKPMFLISKKTGGVDTIKRFNVPDRRQDDLWDFRKRGDNVIGVTLFSTNSITQVNNGFILDNFFCDTIYQINKKQELKPILAKYPAYRTMKERPLVIDVNAASNRFLFFEIQEHTHAEGKRTFPKICFDRTNNQIVEYRLKNKDIINKKTKVVPYTRLYNADDLIELLEEGKLKGKLKTIAENLKEDDNPVLIKVTLKSISN